MRRTGLAALVISIAFRSHAPANAAPEICGNNADEDGDGHIDEGCNPEAYLKVRESPLPRSAVGSVSPLKGQEVWSEPPDFDIAVAYGPKLTFQRSYHSQVTETGQARGPLGTGWMHNYMSWIDFSGLSWANVRLVTGQDVHFASPTTCGTWTCFTPQPGYFFKYLRGNGTTWELVTLEGWTYTYTGSPAYLDSIKDAVGNALTITRTGGRIDKVTAAVGLKELRFTYGSQSPNQLTTVKYYADNTLRATLSFPNNATPATASLEGAAFRNYMYTSGKLTIISDVSSHTIAEFKYSSDPGKTFRVQSGKGFLGYGYPVGDPLCLGGFYLYYNLKDNPSGEGSTCTTDTDCNPGGGSVYFCGGVTGGSGTGMCFRARRCVFTTTNPSEDCVCAVSSSCPTCTATADRIWDTTALTVKGQKDAENHWTSYLRNSNGLPTTLVEGDDDELAGSVPTGARASFNYYDNTSFPGLVTEVRRQSPLKAGSACTATSTTDCKRTLYTYTTAGKVDTVQEIGFTYDSSGAVVSYNFTTDYDYDAQGRLRFVYGPRTDTTYDVTEYTYWSGAGNLKEGYLKEVKRQTGASTFVTTAYNDYDYWGNPIQITDPNSNLTCLTFDAKRNVLTTERIAMANQTTCTANAADLVTTYTYDSALNVTKVQKPEGNCNHYEYDTRGRLSKLKSRDDCNAASTGDTQEFSYDDAGNLIKTEYKDSTGAVTYRQEKTYGADGRVLEIINPADVTKKKTLAYKSDGMLESITGEDAVGKTEWTYDTRNRTDAEKRYKTGSTFDTWDLTYGDQLDHPTKVQDDDTKHLDWVWDDLGRKVKQISPDAGTLIQVYDPAGNLTTQVEAQGSADQRTHTFTYDPMNRLTAEDYGDAPCPSLGGAEIQYFYDNPASCLSGHCLNSNGRLGYSKTKIYCFDDGPGGDDTFNQFTYLNYDDAGRIVKEAIRDDATRADNQLYEWNKNGKVTKTTAPSGYYQKSVFGTTGNNSDKDRLIEVDRGNGGTDTVITDSGKWYPFGPTKEYRQSNTTGTNKTMARLTWDLAYRPSNILYEQETSGTDMFRIAYTLDAQGRVTIRDFTGGDANVQDSYYTYDWQNRIICDAAVSGGCPPLSDNDLKSYLYTTPPYSASSDRQSLRHRNAEFGVHWYAYAYVTGRDQVDTITRADTQTIDLAWDGRGNRLYDDDAEWADDRRDYTYDARDNLITATGKLKISPTVVHDYTMVNAYDHRNRRFFKSVVDTTANPDVESQYFYYYDLQDRLIEVKYTPNITDTTTYQVFQFYWIDNRPVFTMQTSYPGATQTRRFIHADDVGTPLEMWTWPVSGSTTRDWAKNPDAFGWDDIVLGSTLYQPLRFPGQRADEETKSWRWNSGPGAFAATRPALCDNQYRVYDPFAGAYLQADPMVAQGWNSYAYAGNNAVMVTDATGLLRVDWDMGGPGPNTGGGGGGGGGDPEASGWWGVPSWVWFDTRQGQWTAGHTYDPVPPVPSTQTKPKPRWCDADQTVTSQRGLDTKTNTRTAQEWQDDCLLKGFIANDVTSWIEPDAAACACEKGTNTPPQPPASRVCNAAPRFFSLSNPIEDTDIFFQCNWLVP